MAKLLPVALLAPVLVLASCAHAPEARLATIEPLECEVIARMTPAGGIKEIAWPAPTGGWIDGTGHDAWDHGRKRRPASLRECPNLVRRLADSGSRVSRVAFNADATRAIIEIDCGPAYLHRGARGTWIEDAVYTSVHGCESVP